MRITIGSAAAFAAALFASAHAPVQPVLAQQALEDPGQKTVQMTRTATPPVIDGVLDEAVWENAALVDNLHQVDPIEYAEPFEHTEVYLLYDDDALYVGVKLYDTDPDEITARTLRQNSDIGQDDRFFVTLDPFNDQRSGYYFGVNPNGVRMDGIYQNVTEFYSDWDSIYDAKAGRFEDGWIAEFEIPFTSISFDPTTDTWGLNFSRSVVRKNEVIAWVTRNRQYNPSASGLAIGFEGLQQGMGLDIVPSATAASSRSFAANTEQTDLEPSLDVSYRLTPQLNASLTLNTDFSATEVDDRQVNLTRFSLFFPEKRDFFLREADIFEFGRIGGSVDAIYSFGSGGQNGRPFFSRRIGLSGAGQPVDLDYGTKLSGRIGDWELGALSIRQDSFGTADADTLSVVRAKLGILSESSVGVIMTDGNPSSNVDNSLAGFDLLYRNTRLPGGRLLEAEVWAQETDTEGLVGDNGAAGIGVRIPSASGFRGGVSAKRFERNFNPALGFLNRRDITDNAFDVGYTLRPRQGRIQSLQTSFDAQRIDTIDGGLQTQSVNFRPFALTNRTGDRIMMVNRVWKENLAAPFRITPNVEIPAGQYGFRDTGLMLQFANHRRFSGRVRVVDGTFYDGTKKDKLGEVIWRPSAKLRGSVLYDYSEVVLPQGAFETRLVALGIDYVFSSTLSWVNLIQYDNVSETTGVNLRLHWVPEAGRELFFVINHNLQDFDRNNTFESLAADITVKYTHTLRF